MQTTLDRIFAATVARGWRPATPAVGADLARCEVSIARGTCLEPLVREGDEVFADLHAPAQPGDLVQFRLSARGAAAQNSALPAGQSPCQPGDRWLKLLARYHDFDMLLEKYGRCATATFLACERPDDTPLLHPVVNIARRGELLFSYASGIGANAATITDVAHSSPAGVNTGTGVSGNQLLNPVMTMSNSPNYDCTAIVTMNIVAAQNAGTVGDASLLVAFADDSSTLVYSTSTYKLLSSSSQQYTLQWEFSHLGTNAGLGKVHAAVNFGSTSDSLLYGPCTLQVEYVIR
jgi:hypothetical protein